MLYKCDSRRVATVLFVHIAIPIYRIMSVQYFYTEDTLIMILEVQYYFRSQCCDLVAITSLVCGRMEGTEGGSKA